LVLNNTSNMSITVASGPAGAIISGQTIQQTVGGVATFADLSVNKPGTYTFKFTDGNLTSTISATAVIVPIPISEHFTLNGLALSTPSLLLQQARNAIVYTIAGPPTQAEVTLAAAEGNNAEVDTLFSNGFVAATAAVPAATFSSGDAISAADVSAVLDTSPGDTNLLD
jgi:hypothetical protein